MFSNFSLSTNIKTSYTWKAFIFGVFAVIFILSSCNSATLAEKESQTEINMSYVVSDIRPTSSTAFAPATNVPSSTATVILTPTQIFTPTPDTRPLPYYWREWPVSPGLSLRAQEIIMQAASNPDLDLHVFSKVGDCQMTSETFLGGFANGKYKIPEGRSETVVWFSDSMMGESVTAANGLGINSVLNPMFGLAAGHSQCGGNELPLDCELRTKHPAFVLIGMGTNWKPNGELSFEKYLRVVVDRVLGTGALPILATKADNIEGDWKLNQAIVQVAYDYDLPLVNVWRSVHDLPNHGLEGPKNIYLTGDGWMRRNYAWLDTLEKIRLLLVAQ